MRVENNVIIFRNGERVALPTTGHIKLNMQTHTNKVTGKVTDTVCLNGKEWKDGKWKVTFKSILRFLGV